MPSDYLAKVYALLGVLKYSSTT